MTIPSDGVPLAAFAATLALALALNAIVVASRSSHDSGGLWARVLVWSTVPLASLILYAWTLDLIDSPWWAKGWHPMPDAVSPAPVSQAHWWALGIPFAVWWVLVPIALVVPESRSANRPDGFRPGAWLAGSAGFTVSRRWIMLALAPPFLLVLLWTAHQLGTDTDPYPAALWGTLAVVTVNLIALSFSRGRRAGLEESPPAERKPRPRPGDWAGALRRRGFKVEAIGRIEPDPDPPSETDHPGARALIAQWPILRERRVAPELIEAVADLFGTGDTRRRHGLDRLILGPDDCGQLESLAVAIRLTQLRLEMVSLVAVPRDPTGLAERLAPWLPEPGAIHLPRANVAVDPGAMVWVVDAGTLSEQLADLADHPPLLNRIGLVVWWDLDAYSGVLAASFWAVSHRLDRLVKGRGHRETRSIAFARYYPSPEASQTAFVTQLLPYSYEPEDRVVIPARPPHPIELYLLETTRDLASGHTDPSLVAARTSVEAGWRTCYEPPESLDLAKAGDHMQQRVAGRRLSDLLCRGHADAGARILEIGAAEVLSIVDLLSQGGRCLADSDAHRVGLLLPAGNPYVRHLLGKLRTDRESVFGQARRLVPGVPQPAVVRRHLLLALREMEAVANGLLSTFQWRDYDLDPVLKDLADRHQVERRDVRFLDSQNRLKVDTGYKSTMAEYRPGPLDTVGEDLIRVILREAGAGEELLMRIDPERATVVAYPGRVFRVEGRTYRMSRWPSSSMEEIKRRGLLYCTRTDDPSQTWRIGEPRLRRTRPHDTRGRAAYHEHGPGTLVVKTQYAEELIGILEVRRDPLTAEQRLSETPWGEPIEGLAFETDGLLLRFLEEDTEDSPAALHSIAQALSQTMAVHVGVEQDAIRVMAAERLKVGRRHESGILILDLYPNGIGLTDALNEDDGLIRRLLEHTRDWLAACPCGSEAGCPLCLQSPPSIAATRYSVDRRLSRQEAVDVLCRVLGRG